MRIKSPIMKILSSVYKQKDIQSVQGISEGVISHVFDVKTHSSKDSILKFYPKEFDWGPYKENHVYGILRDRSSIDVPEIIDFGVYEDHPYILMEKLEGHCLP